MRKSAAPIPSRQEVQVKLGVAVRKLREEHTWTQEQLAAAAEVHWTYVSQVERGLKNVSLYTLHRLAHAFGVSPASLLDKAESKS